HPGAAETREVLEEAAEDDLRHLVLRRHAPAAARRVQALRRGRWGWYALLPPALLPGRSHQRPPDHSPDPTGAAVDRRSASRGPPVAGVDALRAACRVLPHRDGLHHQRGDIHRNHGLYSPPTCGLTPDTAKKGAARLPGGPPLSASQWRRKG